MYVYVFRLLILMYIHTHICNFICVVVTDLCFPVIYTHMSDRQNAVPQQVVFGVSSRCFGARTLNPKTKAECDIPLTKSERYNVDVPGFACLLETRGGVPVLKLYYKRTKIQPAAGDGRSSIKIVPPENEYSAGRRRRPFQYYSCTTRE